MFSKVLTSGPQKLALYGKELKAVADNKVKVTQIAILVLDIVHTLKILLE